MFDYDRWLEILASLRHNKLRAGLTMFGVFWGLLLLTLMLGAGSGLSNGMQRGFSGLAKGAFWLWGMRTTMPYNGMGTQRGIHFTNADLAALKASLPEITAIVPYLQLGGYGSADYIVRGSKAGAFNVRGTHPTITDIEYFEVQGRNFNWTDVEERRKVAILGTAVVDELFEPGESPFGEVIKIHGVNFIVIGTFRSLNPSGSGGDQNKGIHIPLTVAQSAFGSGENIGWFGFVAKDLESALASEQQARNLIKARHSVHPDDDRAVGSWNTSKMLTQINTLFSSIELFVWLIGAGTLLAGIIGVSNIMLIVVKERTREIGVRKSIGATPGSIIALILQESIAITVVSGYLGLFTGIAIVEIVGGFMRKMNLNSESFANPQVSFQTALAALILLVVFGALAGVIPARKAAAIEPVEAMRN